MRTHRALALIPVAGLLFAGCVKGEATTQQGTLPSGHLNTNVTSTLPVTVFTTAPADTSPGAIQSGPVQIDVRVGTDSGANRIERVKVGSSVTLNITNPNAAEDYHVHLVDLEQKVAKNTTATFNFTVGAAGNYVVESHVTKDVLLVIEVSS